MEEVGFTSRVASELFFSFPREAHANDLFAYFVRAA